MIQPEAPLDLLRWQILIRIDFRSFQKKQIEDLFDFFIFFVPGVSVESFSQGYSIRTTQNMIVFGTERKLMIPAFKR